MLVAVVVTAALIATVGQAAENADIAGWPGIRWGMTTVELDGALKGRIRPLKGRLDYGSSYAERMVSDVRLGAAPFTTFFQMDRDSDRLHQILLDLRRSRVTMRRYNDVLFALRGRYGPPTARCIDLNGGDTPRAADVVWHLPTTTVRAVFFDFHTTSILFEASTIDVDPLEPYYAIRRINARFLPRRILVRLSPAELATQPPCPR